jgi:hypothetical protein
MFALVVALTTTVSSVVHAAPENTPQVAAQLTVRVYDMTMVPAADQTAALRAAAGVLVVAGINTAWVICGSSAAAEAGGAAEGCERPLGASEVSVRLTRLPATPNAHGMLQLGYSLVNTQAGEGKLATVFVDRVEWLARPAGADSPTILGFAMAHEIGHLLLGTNAHAASGLMRALWSRHELQHARNSDWLFLPAEASRMRTALFARKGLEFSQHNPDASGCSASDDGAADRTAGCDSTASSAALRGVAAGGDR